MDLGLDGSRALVGGGSSGLGLRPPASYMSGPIVPIDCGMVRSLR